MVWDEVESRGRVRNTCTSNRRAQRGRGAARWVFNLEEGEIPVALDLSDLQVPHDDLTAVVTILDQVVLVLLGACGAQAVLRAVTHH